MEVFWKRSLGTVSFTIDTGVVHKLREAMLLPRCDKSVRRRVSEPLLFYCEVNCELYR
jgi:hypothetical protein